MIKRNIIFIPLFLLVLSCGSDSSTNVPPEVKGDCMNPEACNFNPEATIDVDEACWYTNFGCECSDGENAISDCNNECNGSATYDSCGVCSGGSTGIQPGSTCGLIENGCDLPINTIGFVPKLGNDWYGKVIYNIDPSDIIGIAAFQFDINNAEMIFSDTFNPNLPIAGGDAAVYGLDVTASAETQRIAVFSFEGNAIQISNGQLCGELINIAYNNNFTSNEDEVFLSTIVFSNTEGESIEVSYQDTCLDGKYDCYGLCDGDAYIDLCSNCVEGTTNQDDCADGYVDCYGDIGIDANVNVSEDCAGVCGGDAIEDCLGECGGTALLDECGVCGGSGPSQNFDCDGNCLVDVDCNGVCGGSSILDCNNICNGSSALDSCGICDGDGSSCQLSACDIDNNSLYLSDLGNNNYSIFYNTSEIISGFQFNIKNDLSNVNISSISGGDATENNFSLQNNGNLVLGFSFSGGVIPAGCGTLLNVSLESDANIITDIVISDPSGTSIPFNYHNDN